MRNKSLRIWQILNVTGLLAVIVTNILANVLPINGQTTGEVSAQYENLFTPAGYTFFIWTVIYIGLMAFVVFQFLKPDLNKINHTVIMELGASFFISCLANTAWVIAWHHEQFLWTLVCMALLLLSLIYINRGLLKVVRVCGMNPYLEYMAWVPFGLYLGWICVASIANGAVYLTYAGWNGVGISQEIWAVVMMIIATIIGFRLLSHLKAVAVAIAITWGIAGIYMEQWQNDGNKSVMLVASTMSILLVLGMVRTVFYRIFKLNPDKKIW